MSGPLAPTSWVRPQPGFLRRVLSRVCTLNFGSKLIVFTTLLTALVISSAFLSLSIEIKRSTRRLLVSELGRSQKMFLDLQDRSLSELLWASALITQSPTLRAAMETYRLESAGGDGARADLLATIQNEVEKIVSGLDRDLLLVTDDRGRVLAVSERLGARPGVGQDLSSIPVLRGTLDSSAPIGPQNFAVLRFENQHFLVGCVPIVLQDFPVGALVLGDSLDRSFVPDLLRSFDGRIVVAVEGQVINSTLGQTATREFGLRGTDLEQAQVEHQAATLRLGEEDYVVAPQTLGFDEGGRTVRLYLLQSLTRALEQPHRAWLRTLLIQATLAVSLGALLAWGTSRSILRPLRNFVSFMRVVAETGDYSRRFEASKPRSGVRDRVRGRPRPDERRPVQAAEHTSDELGLLANTFNGMIGAIEERELALRQAHDSLASQVEERTRELRQEASGRRDAERQLRQAQKMEAVGRLAGGVAHDFNNLLTVICGYSETMLERLRAGDPLRSNVEEIRKAGERAASLTRQLLAFSRKQVLELKVLDLNAVVGSMQKMLDRLIGEDVHLVTDLDPKLGRVKADPGQLEQVIMNLAVNARDAMPRGGRLSIETQDAYLDEAYAETHVGAEAGPFVMLAMSDNGCGMDAETLNRIFEPFFTTKEIGVGTGLGLSTVFGIVKQSGGYISAYSEPGRGTSFKIYLPRVEEAAEAVAVSDSSAAVPKGSGTILLVEDEAVLRQLARDILTSSGYTVLQAPHGGEALLLCERHRGPIDLILTDVIMPHMNGRELYERLAARRPGTKVLYMSGYTGDAIAHQGVLDPGTAFIQKPFALRALLQKVREVLEGQRDTEEPVSAPPDVGAPAERPQIVP